jgi:hypothetical protein
MTGSAACALLLPFPASAFSQAFGATSACACFVDEVAGHIILPPGGAIGITGAAGTASVLQAAIM